jgi:hypothetical protein
VRAGDWVRLRVGGWARWRLAAARGGALAGLRVAMARAAR